MTESSNPSFVAKAAKPTASKSSKDFQPERDMLKAIFQACETNQLDELRALQAKVKGLHGEDASVLDYVDGNNTKTIHVAARNGSGDVAQWLLSLDGSLAEAVDAKGRTPLMFACSLSASADRLLSAFPEVFSKLSAKKEIINQKCTEDGSQAVHFAATHPTAKVLEALLAGGADANAASSSGNPLHWFAAHFNEQDQDSAKADPDSIVRVLVKHGAQVDVVDPNGATPLLVACLRGQAGIAKALLKIGSADASKARAQNLTACGAAAVSGSVETLDAVLSAVGNEALFELDPVEKLRPVDHAAHAGHKAMVQHMAGLMASKEKIDVEGLLARAEQLKEEAERADAEAEAKAQDLKTRGNELFAKAQYKEAVEAYMEGAGLARISRKTKAILKANASACLLKLDILRPAVEAAAEAGYLDPTYVKAHYRLGQALSASGDHEGAATAYWEAHRLEPNGKDAATIMRCFQASIAAAKAELAAGKTKA